ncbi:MAG TPA: glycine betaine ABC transporter substrate-binding protein [Solirubrobacterales bacterium]|nr:glycine betaine ABC transporter substrate-binding protein [Solirubrobacterales bacterium]
MQRNLILAVAALVLLPLLAAACGGGSSDPKPTVVVGARATPEEQVLGEIYAQALRRAGFKVPAVVRLANEPESAPRVLRAGGISAYPDHLSTASGLAWAGESESVPADVDEAFEAAKSRLEGEEMTALPPAPFSSTNLLVAHKATAKKLGLGNISDIASAGQEQIVIAGITGCHESINCMEGLEKLYHLTTIGLVSGLGSYDEVFEQLEDGFAELAFIPSTDGRLYARRQKYTVLEDDKHLFPAGNGIFVTTPQLLDEAGSDFEDTIVSAQEGLTTEVMQRLDAEVELEGKQPKAVATRYLAQSGS